MEKTKVITIITVVIVTLLLVGVLVAAVVGRDNTAETEPTDTTVSTETEVPEKPREVDNKTLPDTCDQPIEDQVNASAEGADFDVSEMTRNPEPNMVGGEIEYGTKD